MSKPKPPGDETIKNHPAFSQGVTDSYVGRMKVSLSELKKIAEAAPEVSQGPWRERAYQARSVMDRQEINQTLLAALRTVLGNANHPRTAFDALKTAWFPALRQAVEQAGGDGIDVWIYGLFSPPVRVPKQPLFSDIAEALIRLRTARDLGMFEEEGLKIVDRIDTALSDPARVKISFKQMEKELEGKLEVDEVLAVRGSADDELSRRLHEIGGGMEKLRDEIRGSGKQPSGIFANFVRLKYELKLLDLEMKRRSGSLQSRSSF